LLAYRRKLAHKSFAVILNFSGSPAQNRDKSISGTVCLSTSLDREHARIAEVISINANQGLIMLENQAAE
jgi:hypothetical protein